MHKAGGPRTIIMSKGWKIAWIIAAIVLVPGGIYAGIGIYMLMKIDYSMAGYKIKSFNSKFLYIDVSIRIANPSVLAVKVAGYDLLFYLNDVLVANIKNKSPKTIEPNAQTMLTLPLAVDLHAMDKKKAKEIMGFVITGQWDKITLKVGGKFNGELLKIPVPYKLKPEEWTYTLEDIIKIMQTPAPTPAPKP